MGCGVDDPEQEAALQVAALAKADMERSQRAYRRAMKQVYELGVPTQVIARRVGMRYDAVRMDRKRAKGRR